MVSFYTIGGIVQKHSNMYAMLEHYNRNGKKYALRESPEGFMEMWHKGENRKIGEFRADDSARAAA